MSDATLVPVGKSRAALLKGMTPETRAIAEKFEGKMTQAAVGLTVLAWQLGNYVNTMMHDEGTYGEKGVDDLAKFLNIDDHGTQTLLNYGVFAATFDQETVKQKSAIAFPSGKHLTVQHWLMLTRLKDVKDRNTLLAKTLKEGWSARDLEAAVRAGVAGAGRTAKQAAGRGRNPKVPKNLIVGLQKFGEIGNKFVRFGAAGGSIFDLLDELPSNEVDDNTITRAEATLKNVTDVITTAEGVKAKLEHGIERLKELRETSAAAPAEGYDEAAQAETPKAKPAAAKKKLKKKKKAAAAG